MVKNKLNKQETIHQRFRHRRNIFSKSLTTLIFAIFMWHGRLTELRGVPATHDYWVVKHSFDNGLLFAIAILALAGVYVCLSKRSTQTMRVAFLMAGFSIWTEYAALFLYRDLLFPNWPSLQSMLVVAITISFLIDLLAGDA